MKFVDEVEEMDGNLVSGVMGGECVEMSPFGIPFDYHHDDSVTL